MKKTKKKPRKKVIANQNMEAKITIRLEPRDFNRIKKKAMLYNEGNISAYIRDAIL